MAKILISPHPPQPRDLDFTLAFDPRGSKAGQRHPDDPRLSMSKKAIRNRSRRRGGITEREFNELYKPIEQWDEQELARGRPRAADGTFRGTSPRWLTRELHEKAMDRFKTIIGDRMREESVNAIGVVANLLNSEEVDEKGKPVVPPSVQLQAAQWLVEHVVGKPKQRTETDISVKLQGILAHAMVGGAEAPSAALPAGIPASPSWSQIQPDDGVYDGEVVDDDD
jgi:hypothetical protein